MPEGPEIKRSADKIARAVEGKPLQAVRILWPALKAWQSELSQHRIVKVEARSKALLLHWSNHFTLYNHNQLYGVWYVRPNGQVPQTGRALRLVLQGPQSTAWLYSATDLELLDTESLQEHPYLRKLGPDVLSSTTDISTVIARFQDPHYRNRRLYSLLLDQGFLAGLGNYLRSEILFVAGVPITYRPKDCSATQIQQLAEAALRLPRQSYQTGGVTLDLALSQVLKAKGARRNRYRFYVFAKAGEPCVKCHHPITKTELGGRRIYHCPHCQSAEGVD